MGFSIEAVEDKVKAAFSGKKKWLILGAGVAIIGLIVYMRKQSANTGAVQFSSYPTLPKDYAGQVGSGSGGGSGSGVSADDLALIRDNFSSQLTDLGNTLADRIAASHPPSGSYVTPSQLADAFTGLTSDISAQVDHTLTGATDNITKTVNDRLSTFGGTQETKQAPLRSIGDTGYRVDTTTGNIFKGSTWVPSTTKLPTEVRNASREAKGAAPLSVVPSNPAPSKPVPGSSSDPNTYYKNTLAEAQRTGNKGLATWAKKQMAK